MSIRLPLYTVLDSNQTVENGAGVAGGNASVKGGVAFNFTLPQDTDNVVVKFSASIVGGGGASATFQTTDDGGTTWYDVARTSVISYGGNSILGGTQDNVEWLSIPVFGPGVRTATINSSVVATGSVQVQGSVFGTVGNAAASSLGIKSVSGLPILSQRGRIFVQYTGTITSIISQRVTVSANSQSAGA